MEDDGTYIRSPIIAFSKLLFPLPTSPIMQRNSPFLMQRSISYKVMNFPRLFLVSSFSSSSTFALSFFFLLSFSLSFFLLSLLSVSFSFELNPQLKLPLILTYPIYEGSWFFLTVHFWTSCKSINFWILFSDTIHSTRSLKNIGILIIGSFIRLNRTRADTAVLKSKVLPIPMKVENVIGANKLGKKYTDPIMMATITPLFLSRLISFPLLRKILPKKSSYQE